jgi:lipoate-protein ligase B
MDYVRGWAWQTVLLQQRLLQEPSNNDTEDETRDTILLLEHDPVYTLGRGADETYIRNLFDPAISQNDPHRNSNILEDCRRRLSRQNRLRATASRLMMETNEYRQLLPSLHPSTRNPNGVQNDNGDEHCHHTSMVDLVCQHCIPPNPVRLPRHPHATDPRDDGVPVYRVERGGQVTFHGPGQLMIYPIFDLARSNQNKKDLHWFVRQMEEVIIRTLQDILPLSSSSFEGGFHIHRDAQHTGVWIKTSGDTEHSGGKIAAIGIHAARWITSHGVCLNVHPDLSYFDRIVPCGIPDRAVTSIDALLHSANDEETLKRQWSLPEVAHLVLKHMQEVFQIDLVYGKPIA